MIFKVTRAPWWFYSAWLGSLLGLGASVGQPATNAPPQPPAAPNRAQQIVPLPPVKSPVAVFREFLAMSREELRQSLASRPPKIQKQILAKVREYKSLQPNEQELRLRVTELRWYLIELQLLTSPSTNRVAQLMLIPIENRKLVLDRLRQWDQLSPQTRKQLLENEATLQYFTEISGASEEQRQKLIESISPARREKLEAGIAKWRTLPENERRALETRFNQFFELTSDEKQRALSAVSAQERQQIERTLQTFAHLTPPQRVQCIRSLNEYTRMSLAERQQFLRNAERWRLMTPDERNSWRELIRKISSEPPIPPGVGGPQPKLPPTPIGSSATVATNGR